MNEHTKKTLDYYNNRANEFQQSIASANMNTACDVFLSLLKPSSFILDLGCGTGRDSKYFIDQGYLALPVDGSKEMCRIATEVSGVQAQNICFEELNYNEVFDGVWACASLLHADRTQLPEILLRINRALKPEGILYMSFKYGKTSCERGGRFFSDMTEDDLPFLCNNENGLKVISYHVSEDVRPERAGEKWINIYARKE